MNTNNNTNTANIDNDAAEYAERLEYEGQRLAALRAEKLAEALEYCRGQLSGDALDVLDYIVQYGKTGDMFTETENGIDDAIGEQADQYVPSYTANIIEKWDGSDPDGLDLADCGGIINAMKYRIYEQYREEFAAVGPLLNALREVHETIDSQATPWDDEDAAEIEGASSILDGLDIDEAMSEAVAKY